MSKKKSSEFSLRRITLQIFLQSNSPVTIEQIAKLPVYQRLELSRAGLIDRIHEDLKILRDSGVDVVTQMRGGVNYYFIDSSDEIPLDLSAGFDATLLRAILDYHSDIEQVLYAKAGVNKLLAEADLAQQRSSTKAQVVANLPKGAYIAQIAQAIAKGRGIEFAYYSLSSRRRRTYRVIPQALVPHFESFYLRAYLVKSLTRDSISVEEEPRFFRTVRILSVPKEFSLPQNFSLGEFFSEKARQEDDFSEDNPQQAQTDAKQDTSANTSNDYFAKVSAIVSIKSGCALPLRNIAKPLTATAEISVIDTQNTAGIDTASDIFQLAEMYQDDLFELLSFYGTDVHLLGPKNLLEDWLSRLSHIADIAKLNSEANSPLEGRK